MGERRGVGIGSGVGSADVGEGEGVNVPPNNEPTTGNSRKKEPPPPVNRYTRTTEDIRTRQARIPTIKKVRIRLRFDFWPAGGEMSTGTDESVLFDSGLDADDSGDIFSP